MTSTPVQILLIEDDDVDTEMVFRAAAHHSTALKVIRVANGNKALALLHTGDYQQRPPDVIVLDLYLPGMHGFEFLGKLRADDRLAKLPVFVLTSSDFPQDQQLATHYQIVAYIHKSRFTQRTEHFLKLLLRYLQRHWREQDPREE